MLNKEITNKFGIEDILKIEPLSTGLINNSFAIETENGKNVLLQQVNTSIFLHPENIQYNYQIISDHFKSIGGYELPPIIKTIDNELLNVREDGTWRCFEFFKNTYSPLVANTPEEAYTVAKCFGKFSADLSTIDIHKINYILPGFHNLEMRFQQFQTALSNTSKQRRKSAETLIQYAFDNIHYVEWFQYITKHPHKFPLHILHQDCKISNILFWEDQPTKICPIDLDTTQPGLFFSDMGDMIRSMAPNISENDTNIEDMELRTDFYDAIKNGYLESMGRLFTSSEKEDLDICGNIIIYMQALRFLTDFLNGDIYYKTSYPEQNRNRTENQFKLLSLLKSHQQNNKSIIIHA